MLEWELKPEEIQEKIKNMVWSFSRVNSYKKCSYAWYKSYIEEEEGAPNAYAQFGTICHETLEKYLKGELDMFSASPYYQDNYCDYVTADFPPNKYVDLGEKTFLQGKEYFDNINFDFEKFEVLGVEQEFNFKVGKYPFHGFVDALYRDKKTGEIILRDHKTSTFKYLKNGNVSKKDKEHFNEFLLQEYLYCIPLIEKYGKVDYLSWNMIRDQRIIEVPFNQSDFEFTQQWCIETIKEIEKDMLWLPNTSNSYWCNVICPHKDCYYKQ